MDIIKRIRTAKLVAVAYSFHPHGGSCVSINHYCAVSENRGEYVEKLDLRERRAFTKAIMTVLLARAVLFNGLKCFESNLAIFMMLLRRNGAIYLQESEYALRDFARIHPVRHWFLSVFLQRRKVACISGVQAHYLQAAYGAQRTKLVYNTLPLIDRAPYERDGVKILMVGYVMARKGVELFSRLADYARDRGEAWHFYWIGGGYAPELYFSKNVHWLGYKEHPQYYYPLIDVFFLASQDEPLGMVCAEALTNHKRCVAYGGTGYAELIRDILGCAVFEEYTVAAAYEAIRMALSKQLDVMAVQSMLERTSGAEDFIRRFDAFCLND